MRELKRMGMEKTGRERGRGRDKQRETELYSSMQTSLKPVKQREMGVRVRDEERQSFLFSETVSLLLTYTGDPELL